MGRGIGLGAAGSGRRSGAVSSAGAACFPAGTSCSATGVAGLARRGTRASATGGAPSSATALRCDRIRGGIGQRGVGGGGRGRRAGVRGDRLGAGRLGASAASGRRLGVAAAASGVTASGAASGAAASSFTASGLIASWFSAIGGEACCAPSPGLSVLDTSGSVPRRIRETAPVTAVPAGLPAPDARATVAVAFCPSPPLLLPGASRDGPAPETTALRRACAEAVDRMLAVRPGGRRRGGRRCRRRRPVRRRGRRRPARIRRRPGRCRSPGRPGPAGGGCPLAHTLGAWLLDEAGFAGTRVGVGPADLGAAAARPARPGRRPRDGGRLGPAHRQGARLPRRRRRPVRRRRRRGPGRRATPRRSAALDPAEGERLLAAGVPTWRAVGAALAGRDGHRPPAPATTRRSASATSSPTGSPHDDAAAGRRRRRPDRHREDGARRRARAAARRRGGQRRLDAALPRHGHRHRQARPRRARRRAASPARPLARPRAGVRRRVPGRGPAPRSTGCARPGVVPLLVGGSGLYVRAVLDELDFPGTDAVVRARLEARAGRRRAPPSCTSRLAGSTRPRRRRCCPATDGGSCARWR